jgi:hypothetical protein
MRKANVATTSTRDYMTILAAAWDYDLNPKRLARGWAYFDLQNSDVALGELYKRWLGFAD